MILRSLTLKNFRQFYETQRVDFAGAGTQNTTVFYAANGAGKTTILNAFTWNLFDKMTPAFENPSKLLNERALNELKPGSLVDLSVQVTFEHDGAIYDVVRSQTTERDIDGTIRERPAKRRILLQARGATDSVEDGTDLIRQILPSQLHQFFFFDGERIEKLVNDTQTHQQLDSAIKTILGLEVLEKAVTHIPEAKKLLKARMRKGAGSGSVSELASRSEDLDNKRSACQQALQTEVTNRQGLEVQRSAIDKLLRDHDAAREKQNQLDFFLEQEKSKKDEASNDLALLKKLLSRSYFAFCGDLVTSAAKNAEELRERGQLPAPYRERVIKDLLESLTCICGTPLLLDSPERHRVEALLMSAGRDDLETAWQRIAADADQYTRQRAVVHSDLLTALSKSNSLQSEIKEARSRIDELSAQLRDSNHQDIRDYSSQRDDIQSKIDDRGFAIARLKIELDELEKEFAENEQSLTRAKTDDQKIQILQRHLAAADRIEQAIRDILVVRRERIREQLDERIKKTYASITYKDYVPALSSDFHLSLYKNVGSEERVLVAKGQGENQLMALSFVGALAALARERFEEREKVRDGLSNFEGGIYPIVMDSPFGALDENYRREVANAMPKLAPQCVALMSKSQGLGVVRDEMLGRIGKAYVIEFRSPKQDVQIEQITVGESQLPYISYSADGYEAAVIHEVC